MTLPEGRIGPTRKIGPYEVSAVGLGCMSLTFTYGACPDPDDSVRLINRALDLGCSFLDTAAAYGLGDNERIIARVMHRKQEFTLASKCVMHPDGKELRLDGSPGAIRKSVEASLQRLGIDTLDLCYLHRLDRKVPVEESMGALADLHREGKIQTAGLSEVSAATIRRAHAVFPVTAVQSEYSPWVRNPEVSVLETCREIGSAFVAFSPIGRGFFTSEAAERNYVPGDMRAKLPRFTGDNYKDNLVLLESFGSIAREAGCTVPQLSIAWVLAQGEHVVPIPGTKTISHMEDNLKAASIHVDASTIEAIDRLFAAGNVSGGRYPTAMQANIDTELLPEEMGG